LSPNFSTGELYKGPTTTVPGVQTTGWVRVEYTTPKSKSTALSFLDQGDVGKYGSSQTSAKETPNRKTNICKFRIPHGEVLGETLSPL
jgi:hypothetical protein